MGKGELMFALEGLALASLDGQSDQDKATALARELDGLSAEEVTELTKERSKASKYAKIAMSALRLGRDVAEAVRDARNLK